MNASASRPDRRTAIKWMLTAAGFMAARPHRVPGADTSAEAATPSGRGYGTDPDLMREYQYGDYWPLTLSDEQRRLAAVLCALIIPADEVSPSAADLHVHDFIDEWISAPYPEQQADRARILEGFAWIDAEARRRFGRIFVELDAAQRTAIVDDICWRETAQPQYREAAAFFARYRELTAGGFYTTPEGMRDIGYTGNVPLTTYDGPSPEVIARLGLD